MKITNILVQDNESQRPKVPSADDYGSERQQEAEKPQLTPVQVNDIIKK
jgi:hypothetical protein